MRKIQYLIGTLLFLLGMFFLTSCAEETYYPENITLYLHDGMGGEPTVHEFRYIGDIFFNKRAPIPEREGYRFAGYYDTQKEGGTLAINADGYGIRTEGMGIAKLLASDQPVSEATLHLYARYTVDTYAFAYLTDSADAVVEIPEHFVQGSHSHYGTYYQSEDSSAGSLFRYPLLPPALLREGYEIVGWQTRDGKQLVIGEDGSFVSDITSLYHTFQEQRDSNLTEARRIYLEPVWDLPAHRITFVFGRDTLEDISFRFYYLEEKFEELPYPELTYHNGEYLLGWSTAQDTLIPLTDPPADDVTLYAIFREARPIRAVFTEGGFSRDAYLFRDGTFLTKAVTPDAYLYDLTGWYTDAAYTELADFDTILEGVTLYAKWEKVAKKITLNPNNGDAPYTIYLYQDSERNDYTLPSWDGYEIAGWYTDRNYTGEPLTLDYESVTEDATYYAKWVPLS